MTTLKPLFVAVAIALGAALSSPLATAAAPRPGTAAFDAWVGEQLADLRRLRDESALRDLAFAYGRGNDAIAIRHADREAGKRAGAEEYGRAFAPDVRVEVRALGNPEPIGLIDGIPAWVDFVDQFYAGKGYSSTVHPMSNFRIRFLDEDRASVSAYAAAPHFIRQDTARDVASAKPATEWMLCRYLYEARRQANGEWRITRMQVNLEEIMQAEGFYPGGQRDGR